MAFYLSYLYHISIYSVIIFTIMVTFCKKIDGLIPEYDENKPRYNSLKWYLEIVGLDFESTIRKINLISKHY